MRTMYDSTNPDDIPASAEMVAGYIDGAYAWSSDGWARFPHATHVTVATQPGTNDGDVLDVEFGDATPAQAPAWIRMRQEAGLAVPTIYCASFAVTHLRTVCAGLRYDLWVAYWTGQPHVMDGAVAVQFADPSSSGGHFDLSLVTQATWPAPPPAPPEDPDMDQQTAEAIIWLERTTIFGAAWLSDPNAQAAVSSYASRLVAGENAEGVLTAQLEDAQKDPRLLPPYRTS
jgi:hypothetical protein